MKNFIFHHGLLGNTILENSFESKQSETRTAQGTYKSLFQIKMAFWYKEIKHPLPELGFIPRSGSKNAKNSIFQRIA
ncbi:MAG: hypothetical protein ACKO3R_03815 [bacterium]